VVGTVLAALGLLILGGIGGCATLIFLGFRRPLAHERALFRMIQAVERLAKEIRDIGL
jgi:hypothetical protein